MKKKVSYKRGLAVLTCTGEITGSYTLLGSSYYLLTEFAFRTARYSDQGPEVWTELARSMRKDRGLTILQYEKKTRLIGGPRPFRGTPKMIQMTGKFCLSFCQQFNVSIFRLF